MSMINLNVGNVDAAGTPLPEGEYLFLIEDATISPASTTGDNLKLKMSVEEPVERNGRKHTENLNIQEATLPYVKAFFCAFLGVENDELEEINIDINDLVNNRIIGVIKHVQSNGNTYGNVVAWKHAG